MKPRITCSVSGTSFAHVQKARAEPPVSPGLQFHSRKRPSLAGLVIPLTYISRVFIGDTPFGCFLFV